MCLWASWKFVCSIYHIHTHDLHLRTKLNEHEAWKKNNFSSQVAWSEASNSSRSTANSLAGFSRYQESIWTFSTTTTFGSRAEPRKQKKKRFQLFEYSFSMLKWAHSFSLVTMSTNNFVGIEYIICCTLRLTNLNFRLNRTEKTVIMRDHQKTATLRVSSLWDAINAL